MRPGKGEWRRARGWSVPTGAIGERAGGARGGATVVLRGTHARARKIVSLMGAHAVPRRAPRAVGAVALPRGFAGGRARRAEHDAAVGPRRTRHARRYATGERVRHRKFGGGVVRAVSGSGRELKVTVEFDDPEIGTKQLLVAYAGLEREWESA